MILVKVRKNQDRKILCLCDKDLIGKTLEEGELALDITKRFYEGEEIGDNIYELIKGADIINAVGKESIELLTEKKVIIKEGLNHIKGVPHVQIFPDL